MTLKNGVQTFYAKSRKEWRKWLAKNHSKEKSVWLIVYRKDSDTPGINRNDAVDEALCYGWIDSKANKRDHESHFQFFSQRNPKSKWSKINREKVAGLIKAGQMTASGLKMVEIAKQSGTWTALDEFDNLTIPDDLQVLFNKNAKAHANWREFSRSSRRAILEWISNAKRPETRQKRIAETVKLAKQNIKAKQ